MKKDIKITAQFLKMAKTKKVTKTVKHKVFNVLQTVADKAKTLKEALDEQKISAYYFYLVINSNPQILKIWEEIKNYQQQRSIDTIDEFVEGMKRGELSAAEVTTIFNIEKWKAENNCKGVYNSNQRLDINVSGGLENKTTQVLEISDGLKDTLSEVYNLAGKSKLLELDKEPEVKKVKDDIIDADFTEIDEVEEDYIVF